MFGAVDVGLDTTVRTSSVGLLAARVASAAARLRLHQAVSASDSTAISAVIRDLTAEAEILRGKREPNLEDESAYAFAGFALGALVSWGTVAPVLKDEDAAQTLENIVQKLARLADGTLESPEEIEKLFLAASRNASSDSGGTGERLEGIPASFGLR